jgi:hypothetical protein
MSLAPRNRFGGPPIEVTSASGAIGPYGGTWLGFAFEPGTEPTPKSCSGKPPT